MATSIRKGRVGSAEVAMLTITDREFAAAQRILGFEHSIADTPCFAASGKEDHAYDFLLTQASSRSSGPAGKAVAQLIEDFRPAFILLVGTAGGVSTRTPKLGDVVIGDFVDYTEFTKLHDGRVIPRKIPYDHPSVYLRVNIASGIKSSNEWQGLIGIDRPGAGSITVHVGHIAAGEKILSDMGSEYQNSIVKIFDKALAFETESYGVAHEIFHARRSVSYNIQYLVIRGVSDLIDVEASNETRELWTPYAASAAVAFGRAVAEKVLSFRPQWS